MTAIPQVEGVGHRRLRARGLDFHLAEAGSGEDVILCLHGWPQHWYMWRRVMPALADRHRVLALDLRGYGWSDAPADGYEKENLASDVLAVLDELGLERVKLIGHDWGGWIGFLLSLRAPQRFERFLALGITPPWPGVRSSLGQAWRFAYMPLVASPGIGYALHRGGTLVPRVLISASSSREAWDETTLRAFAAPFTEPERAHAAVQTYRTFLLREARPVLRGRYAGRRLTVTTLLVNGADDPAIRPEMVSDSQAHAERMELELIDGCGHFIVDEMPDLVIDRARTFFAD
jgi:pimeloyl-ACP methyl ester carboxylesterase